MLGKSTDHMTGAEIDAYYDRRRRENLKRYYEIQAKRAIRQDRRSLSRLAALVAVVVVVCTVFLKLNFQVQQQIYRTAVLQKEIDDLRLENEDTRRRLEDLTDLHEIQKQAQALGMRYPIAEHVIYYKVADNDYMYQEHEIPQN